MFFQPGDGEFGVDESLVRARGELASTGYWFSWPRAQSVHRYVSLMGAGLKGGKWCHVIEEGLKPGPAQLVRSLVRWPAGFNSVFAS